MNYPKQPWFILLIAICTLTISPTNAQIADNDKMLAKKVDEYMNAAVKFTHFSGSVLVARNGMPIISKGYGMANYELAKPNSPQTIFRLGSVTKAITGIAIMMLQEKGKLKLDDPACKYLDTCLASWQPITIRHLLNHSSGLPDFYNLNEFRQKQGVPIPQPELLSAIRNKPLEFAPGSRSNYNNSGYYLLGMIIEKVSGYPYDVFLKNNIFSPLGMTSTGYDSIRRIIKNRASGYVKQNGQLMNAYYVDMTNPYAAGGLISTTEDLLRLDQALYSEKLLTKHSLKEMFTANQAGYGLGWDILKEFNRNKIEKGGVVPEGFTANLSRFPDEGITIIVLGNNFSTHVRRAAIDATAIVFGESYNMPREKKAIHLSPAALQQYVGVYRPEQGSDITITYEGGKLMRQVGTQMKTTLLAEGNNLFFIEGFEANLSFTKDQNGVVDGHVVERSGRVFKAKKIK